MKKKFYGVKKGRQTGVFTSWAACKAQVDGYSGAEYKGFTTEAEAQAFVTTEEKATDVYPQAWIDGSYDALKKVYGWGALIYTAKDASPITLKGAGNDPALAHHRNVAGELLAAQAVLAYAEEAAWQSLHIYYDYEGIAAWATGRWRANVPLTQNWRQLVQETKVRLVFHKVAAHAGVANNEAADALAKTAVANFKG